MSSQLGNFDPGLESLRNVISVKNNAGQTGYELCRCSVARVMVIQEVATILYVLYITNMLLYYYIIMLLYYMFTILICYYIILYYVARSISIQASRA